MTESNGTPVGASLAEGPQRRYLSVLFSDLSGSTRLGASMEAELYAEILAGLRRACRRIVAEHGGTIARLQGDGVLAIFGHPEPREDDGRRATEAALALHQAVREMRLSEGPAQPLGLHSGIHAGLVLLAEGDVELGRFELMGNAPNIAARLCDAAGFDEILVSEETLGPAAPLFVTGERQVFTLAGCPQPVAAYRVLARAPLRSRFEARAVRGLAAFVGRRAELATLEDALAQATRGTPQLVAIAGGAGMGKTRLIEEFLHRPAVQDCAVHRGFCESYLSAEPMQPFLQMLRSLFGLSHGQSGAAAAEAARAALERIDPAGELAHADLLGVLSLAADPSAAPAPVPAAGGAVAALRALFDRLASSRPLLLIVDDWQWADDASRQALAAIAALERPLLVLLATRAVSADDPLRQRARIVELAPLSRDDTRCTLAELLPGAADFVVGEIHAYAGGNPLFIEELCHAAALEGGGPRVGQARTGAAWLASLIESRVARLAADQAQIVRTAAVIGNVVPEWLLERLTGRGAQDPLLRALAEQDFLFPAEQPGHLRFKHGITRDVVYDAVGLHQRRAIHLRVAAELAARGATRAQQETYELLAYHYGAGGDNVEAATFAERAGDKAMGASALDRARVQYCAALAAIEQLGLDAPADKRRWARVVQRLGLACVFDPLGLQDALALFERGVVLARESGDAETLARAEYWLGYICYAKGRAREARRHVEAALALCEPLGNERLSAQVRATLGQVLASTCDYDRALGLLDAAVETKRRLGQRGSGGVAVGSAYSLSCKGLLLGDRGRFDEAHACFEQAIALIDGASHQVESSVRGWASTVYQWQGRWQEALDAADAAVRIGENVRSSHLFAISRALSGYSRWMLTREPAALRIVGDAVTWMEGRKGQLFMSLCYGWLADGLVTLGRGDEARRHAAHALARGRALDRIGEAMACRAMALSAAAAGNPVRAARYLGWALRCAQARSSSHETATTQLCAAQVALALGQRAEARAQLDLASSAFEAMQMRWHLEQARGLWAQVG